MNKSKEQLDVDALCAEIEAALDKAAKAGMLAVTVVGVLNVMAVQVQDQMER